MIPNASIDFTDSFSCLCAVSDSLYPKENFLGLWYKLGDCVDCFYDDDKEDLFS